MRLVERLPDCYRKDEDSNNHKLLELERLATEELRLDIKTVLDSLDLNQEHVADCCLDIQAQGKNTTGFVL